MAKQEIKVTVLHPDHIAAKEIITPMFGLKEFRLGLAPGAIKVASEDIPAYPQYMWLVTTSMFSFYDLYAPGNTDDAEPARLVFYDRASFAFIHTNLWTKAICYYPKMHLLNKEKFNKPFPHLINIEQSEDLIYPALKNMDMTYNKQSDWPRESSDIYIEFHAGIVATTLEYPYGIPDTIENNSLKQFWNAVTKTAISIVDRYQDTRLTEQFKVHPSHFFTLDQDKD